METHQDRLVAAVMAFAAEPFAVVDGALIDRLPELLWDHGLGGRPLLRSPADAGVERAGPWLVPLGTTPASELLGLTSERPAIVFWAWPDGEDALHRHLRRLNVARIPAWAALNRPQLAGDGGIRTVLFRHWDPRVLGAVMPALRADQFRRVLGPAQELAYLASEFGGVRRVVSDPAWPLAPAGPLLLTSEQIEVIGDRRGDARQGRMIAYLRNAVGPQLAGAPDAELHEHLRVSENTGDALGIRSEAGHCRWAFLMYATDGKVARDGEVANFIRSGQPDRQVAALMVHSRRFLRTGELG